MEEEIIKIVLAVVVALLYYLFKSKPVEKGKDAPEKYNSPMAQVPREEAVEKTVSFEDILKKLEQNEPKLNIIPSQEMIMARPAQLKKMLSERIVRLDESENKSVDKINSYKNKPLIKDKDKEVEDAKELQTQKNKSQNKEISNQRDEISDLKRELERYKAYEKNSKEVKNEALIKMLADPQSVRNAFVLSEILNKKI